ncbi:hypothetical protein Tco_1429697 [Tanacetum coccineum]
MGNANPPPTNNCHVLLAALRARIDQELHELHVMLAFVDSRLESIERFLNNFANQPTETNVNNLDSNDEAVDTPLVSPFPHSDNDSDDDEVLNELIEYGNAGTLRRERIINSFDGDDLAFECMIGFRKFTAYLDPFLPMNIISHKAYNTIMVKGLEGTRKNPVSIVKDVYVFVGSFTYITDFVVLEDIGEFIMSNMAKIQRISLTGFPAQSVGSSNTDVLDSSCLLVLITGTSQSRQHGLFVTACELYGVQQVYFDIITADATFVENSFQAVDFELKQCRMFMKKIDLSSSDSEDLNECLKEDIKGKGKSKGKLSGGSMTGDSQRRDMMRAVVVTGFVNSNSYLRDILGKDIDDEESNHEDASDTGDAPKQQQMIPQTTAISSIKLPILKKEEYDIWAMEIEHYLEYIDNEVWKVIQNGNSKKRISTGKDGIV